MIVTAALCFWNEQPEELARAVSSVASVADRIVALDGAYRRYPGATDRSSDAEVEAIRDAAGQMDCLVLQLRRLWAGQVEKRSHLLNAAALNSDWLLILDADYVVSADPDTVRRELAATPFDTLAVPLSTPQGEYATNWHRQQAQGVFMTPLVFRALPGMRVEDRHWWYSGLKGGTRHWLWEGDARYPVVPHGSLSGYSVQHNSALQPHEAQMAARAWYNDVDLITRLTGQEDDVPGLPAPAYDDQRVPF